MGPLLHRREDSLLLVVDVQERHYPHCWGGDAVLNAISKVIQVATILNVPVVVTEQYVKTFGNTVADIATHLHGCAPIEKRCFSAMLSPEAATTIDRLRKQQIVIVGAETHICVLQTALQALEGGMSVTVVEDAVTSRSRRDHELAIARLRQHGVCIATWEMVTYEWLLSSDAPEFKKILPLVKG